MLTISSDDDFWGYSIETRAWQQLSKPRQIRYAISVLFTQFDFGGILLNFLQMFLKQTRNESLKGVDTYYFVSEPSCTFRKAAVMSETPVQARLNEALECAVNMPEKFKQMFANPSIYCGKTCLFRNKWL